MSGGRPVGTSAKKVLGVSEGRPAGTTAVKGCDIVTSEGSPFGTSAGNTITQVHQSLSVGKACAIAWGAS